jgi:hypothetical protein
LNDQTSLRWIDSFFEKSRYWRGLKEATQWLDFAKASSATNRDRIGPVPDLAPFTGMPGIQQHLPVAAKLSQYPISIRLGHFL